MSHRAATAPRHSAGAARLAALAAALLATQTVAMGAEQPTLAPSAAQQRIVAEALEARRTALAQRPDDPLAGAWMVESSELLLAELSLTGADSAALVGLPTVDQRDQALRNAGRALQLAEGAESALAAGVANVEANPRYADETDLQDLRRRLAVEFRMFRAPMVRSRARLILAALAPEDEPRRRRLAQAAQKELLPMRLPSGPAEAQRLTWLGLAELLGAAPAAPPERSMAPAPPNDIPVWFDIALTLEAERPFWRLPARERMESTIGKALASAAANRASAARLALQNAFNREPAQGEDGARNPVWTLLVADGLYRVGLREATAAPGPASRRRALAQACEAHAWLLSLDSLGALHRAQIEALVFEKIAALARSAGGAADEAPLAIVVRARRDIASGGASRVDRAAAALQALVDLPRDEIGLSRVAALQTLALAEASLADQAEQNQAERIDHAIRAAEALIALARDHAEHPDAAPSAQRAEALLQSVAARFDLAQRDTALEARLLAARRTALRLLVDGLAEGAARDRARLELAQLALTPSAAERLALLSAVGADSPWRGEALAGVASLESAQGEPARALAAAEQAERWLAAHTKKRDAPSGDADSSQANEIRLHLAVVKTEALLALSRFDEAAESAAALAPWAASSAEALRALARAIDRLSIAWGAAPEGDRGRSLVQLRTAALEATPVSQVKARIGQLRALAALQAAQGDAKAQAEALGQLASLSGDALDEVACAEALRDAGEEERAFARFRAVAEREADHPSASRAFWLAWAGMLEMRLERAGKAPAQRGPIAEALARLRAIDENLGPDESARKRLRQMEAALKADQVETYVDTSDRASPK